MNQNETIEQDDYITEESDDSRNAFLVAEDEIN